MPFEATTDSLAELTIASQEQIEGIRREVERNRNTLRAYQGGAFRDDSQNNAAPAFLNGETVGNVDFEEVSRSLKSDEETLAKNSPPELSPTERNKVYQYYKAASKEYAEGLLSHGQMRDANAANLQQHMRHQERYGKTAIALRNAIRILDQSEPFSLESMRPIQPNYRNMSAWYEGFDHIKWADEEEVKQLERNLDDETYLRFMTLHSRQVDPAVIRAKLGLGQALYEACQLRLERDSHYLAGELGLEDAPEAPFDAATVTAPEPAGVRPASAELMTELEAHAVETHFAAAERRLLPLGRFSIREARDALGIDDKATRALLRGLVKEGVCVYDAIDKRYASTDVATAP